MDPIAVTKLLILLPCVCSGARPRSAWAFKVAFGAAPHSSAVAFYTRMIMVYGMWRCDGMTALAHWMVLRCRRICRRNLYLTDMKGWFSLSLSYVFGFATPKSQTPYSIAIASHIFSHVRIS
jgi:hypothetical protein